MRQARRPNTDMLLADIGGTNTRVALASGGAVSPDSIRRYSNRKHGSFFSVLEKYGREMGRIDYNSACVAVAGPVRNGRAHMTNLEWVLDLDTLRQATKAGNVAILNDLEAQGYALGHIPDKHLLPVQGPPCNMPGATRLVVGLGTGFNTAAVFERADTRLVTPSESGQMNFPALGREECAFCEYVAERHGFPSLDRILSGRGLETLFAWRRQLSGSAEQLRAAEIIQAVARNDNRHATQTTRLFVRMLGTVAGNLALTYLPFGGLYLTGGVARAIAPYLTRFGFHESFENKGRFREFMRGFPVFVIDDDYAALTGCAAYLNGYSG